MDPQLGADFEAEITALTRRRTFGLVFERHQPEAVELPGRSVRRGDKVRIAAPGSAPASLTNACGGSIASSGRMAGGSPTWSSWTPMTRRPV